MPNGWPKAKALLEVFGIEAKHVLTDCVDASNFTLLAQAIAAGDDCSLAIRRATNAASWRPRAPVPSWTKPKGLKPWRRLWGAIARLKYPRPSPFWTSPMAAPTGSRR